MGTAALAVVLTSVPLVIWLTSLLALLEPALTLRFLAVAALGFWVFLAARARATSEVIAAPGCTHERLPAFWVYMGVGLVAAAVSAVDSGLLSAITSIASMSEAASLARQLHVQGSLALLRITVVSATSSFLGAVWWSGCVSLRRQVARYREGVFGGWTEEQHRQALAAGPRRRRSRLPDPGELSSAGREHLRQWCQERALLARLGGELAVLVGGAGLGASLPAVVRSLPSWPSEGLNNAPMWTTGALLLLAAVGVSVIALVEPLWKKRARSYGEGPV